MTLFEPDKSNSMDSTQLYFINVAQSNMDKATCYALCELEIQNNQRCSLLVFYEAFVGAMLPYYENGALGCAIANEISGHKLGYWLVSSVLVRLSFSGAWKQ